jgi:hypothetical protein
MPAARNLCCAARMEGLPRALCESARVLRVAREGAATSVVAQMLRSNAVLNCTVRTNALKREQINSLEAGQTVLLRVVACAPPAITVEVESVEAESAGGVETASQAPAAKRRRQCVAPLS